MTAGIRYGVKSSILALLLISGGGADGVGQTAPSAGTHRDRIVELLNTAKQQWPLTTPARHQAALEEAKTVMIELADFMAARLRPHAAGWQTFFKLDELDLGHELLDLDKIEEVARRYEGAEPLLRGYPRFAVSPKLTELSRQTRALHSTRVDYEARLEALRTSIQRFEEDGDLNAAGDMGETLGWLYARGAATELVDELRRRYCQTNLYLFGSRQLVSAAVRQSSSEEVSVNETILGTRYRGTNRLSGDFDLDVVPNPNAIEMQFKWSATAEAETRGYAPSAEVDGSSTTRMVASKQLVFDVDGIQSRPTTVTATTSSKIRNVSTRRRRRRQIAWNEARQQRPQTEREVEERWRTAAESEMDRRVAEWLKQTRDVFVRRVRIPWLSRGLDPKHADFYSSVRGIHVESIHANEHQLAVVTPAPSADSIERASDLAVRLHLSAINNLASSQLAQRSLSEEDLQHQLTSLFGVAPSGLARLEDAEQWLIHFAKDRPVHFRNRDDGIEVSVRADGFTVGERQIPGSVITAKYQFTVAESRLVASRQPRLDVVPLQDEVDHHRGSAMPRVGARYQIFRSMLRRRFKRVMPETLSFEPIRLPFSDTDVRLYFDQFYLVDDWVVVSWTNTPQGDQVALAEHQ